MLQHANPKIIFQVTERHMKITQEEKVLVAVTKKEEPPRARGTSAFPHVSVKDVLAVQW